jgi:alpha-galactosidase
VRKVAILLWMPLWAPWAFGASGTFDSYRKIWTLSSDSVSAVFQLTPEGYFLAQSIASPSTGDQWVASLNQPTSPVLLQTDTDTFDAHRRYRLVDQYLQNASPSGVRQFIVLQDMQGAAQITVTLEVYDGQPVLRYQTHYHSLNYSPGFITGVNMLPWAFDDAGKRYTSFSVNQWSTDIRAGNFQQIQTVLDTDGDAVEVLSGAHGQQCGWLAVRDSDTRGVFAGWEFDGRTKATVAQDGDAGVVQFSAAVLDMNHPLPAYGDFDAPYGFIGLFHGDFDEAGYRTQRFVEAVLAKPPPAAGFPFVSWDSWSYQTQIDEETLRRNADVAASIGAELFLVDLGWARSIGDWYEDPNKFPSGLAALSAYVHSLGMKFGLHFAFAEANLNSPVLQANPDWTSTENDGYHGAVSLCLSHQPVRDWLIQQGIRIIDSYNVDWILQDGENMVKTCTKTTHTHNPADSNYANAVDGLNAVVSGIQAARPNVVWENCEDGGNMMTFNMVKNYVTSITNDASGALDSRRAVYGATYPFPPRFTERYMPDSDGLTPYATNSYFFGGPWVLMDQLANLNANQLGTLAAAIRNFKKSRASISVSKVYHILPPAQSGTDAIQSYDPVQDRAVAVITRTQSAGASYTFHPKGLDPNQMYVVSFEISPAVTMQSGGQLMNNGVAVSLPATLTSEIVYIGHE